jgi:predicted amidohydrolase
MRVAAAQVRIDIDDPQATWTSVTSAVREAAAGGARLVVLPELCATGYAFADRAEAWARAEPLDGPVVTGLRELSAELGLVVVAGFCEREGDDGPYNSAVVCDRGDLVAVYRKTHLWGGEKLIFVPGDRRPPVVPTTVGRVAVMICYDLEIPEMSRDVAQRGAQLVAVPVNWPVVPKPSTERPVEVIKAQAAAASNRVFVVVADRCGPERGTDWFASSVILAPTGFPLAGPAAASPSLLTAEVDLADADDKAIGPHNDVLADVRTEELSPDR